VTSNDELRRDIRKAIGTAVFDAQERHKDLNPGVVLPEIIAALLSLASYIASENANLSQLDFLRACIEAAAEQHAKARS
jgi:hypothetical protein